MPEKKIVYWAPAFFDKEKDWNILYYDLESLFEFYRNKIDKDSGKNNFLYCPSFKNLAKNTFLIKNPIHTHYILENDVARLKSRNNILIDKPHPPSIKNNQLVAYGLQFVFFSEHDITAKLTSPFFNDSPHMKNCSLVPGQVNIQKWFRSINLEYNFWENRNEMEFQKDEVLAYVSFECADDDIELQRFSMNEKLHQLLATCGASPSWESFVPLVERYKRFMETRTNVLILNEIKKNLVVNV